MIFADDGDDYSYTTGKRRRIARVKELAGISPAIYAWVFEQVVFLKVAELGFQMPPYAEEIERMVMAEVQREQYELALLARCTSASSQALPPSRARA